MKKMLKKLVRRKSTTVAGPQNDLTIETSMAEDAEDYSEKLTLKDKELIGFIEAIDKRLSSLEHDLWIVHSRMAELTDNEEEKSQ